MPAYLISREKANKRGIPPPRKVQDFIGLKIKHKEKVLFHNAARFQKHDNGCDANSPCCVSEMRSVYFDGHRPGLYPKYPLPPPAFLFPAESLQIWQRAVALFLRSFRGAALPHTGPKPPNRLCRQRLSTTRNKNICCN
jgi:hypothetical protein